MTVLRFVVSEQDSRTGQSKGLLGVAYELLQSGQLARSEDSALRAHVAWFETHVPVPSRFARKANVSHRNMHGLSWIKSGATGAITCLYAIGHIVERHDYVVEVQRTMRPGYVVYEDDIQLVAEPFHGRKP